MKTFGNLKRLSPKDIWKHEARDFTPWLAKNIGALGEALGLDLELIEREASVGDFSLDLLARDLGTKNAVVVENQLTPTDHDHLGKLLTYASGFDASIVIWVADSIRDEHRQTMEWLNQRTDTDTLFFAVVVEVLQIDESAPAFEFRPIVLPNQWRKTRKRQISGSTSERGERYRKFFQELIDKLRDKHRFTGAKLGQPQNWYSFSAGVSGMTFNAVFGQGNVVRSEVYIDCGRQDRNNALFDAVHENRAKYDEAFGAELAWERMDERQASRVSIARAGSIDAPADELAGIQEWMTANLLNMKKVFGEDLKRLARREWG